MRIVDGKVIVCSPGRNFVTLKLVTEDGVPQEIDLVSQETLPATFALLIDSSHSMSRRIDFVQEAARRLVALEHPGVIDEPAIRNARAA